MFATMLKIEELRSLGYTWTDVRDELELTDTELRRLARLMKAHSMLTMDK